jgi:spoIIIJ-associated protein
MSPFIEFEGKNVEQAVTRACKELNIPRDKLRHDVISFGATGIFGLVGIKKARIRVAMPGIRDAGANAPEAAAGPAQADAFADLPAPGKIQQPEIPDPDAAGPDPRPPVREDLAALGRRVLQRLVDSVTSGAEIGVNCGSRQIVYTISGGDPAALIGKKGQTLEAIQYLLKKIVNKSAGNRTPILVDISGYAVKRQDDLQALALRFAEKACRNGKSVTVGRFNPQDRKIIHLALKNDRRVRTQSHGEGYVKKLAVIPRAE